MSKSGLFAHFGSKEELQLATVDYAAALFVAEVIDPARSAPKGLAQDLVALRPHDRLLGAAGLPRWLLLRRHVVRVQQPSRAGA